LTLEEFRELGKQLFKDPLKFGLDKSIAERGLNPFIEEAFKEADKDKNGVLSFEEFRQFCLTHKSTQWILTKSYIEQNELATDAVCIRPQGTEFKTVVEFRDIVAGTHKFTWSWFLISACKWTDPDPHKEPRTVYSNQSLKVAEAESNFTNKTWATFTHTDLVPGQFKVELDIDGTPIHVLYFAVVHPPETFSMRNPFCIRTDNDGNKVEAVNKVFQQTDLVQHFQIAQTGLLIGDKVLFRWTKIENGNELEILSLDVSVSQSLEETLRIEKIFSVANFLASGTLTVNNPLPVGDYRITGTVTLSNGRIVSSLTNYRVE